MWTLIHMYWQDVSEDNAKDDYAEDFCSLWKCSIRRPHSCRCVHQHRGNWGSWWVQLCGKGLLSARGLYLCNELKLPTKDEIHVWSVSESLSGASWPEDVFQSPGFVEQMTEPFWRQGKCQMVFRNQTNWQLRNKSNTSYVKNVLSPGLSTK